jgi:hypothetical protein
MVLGYVLYASLAVTFAALATALVVGLWHLYLALVARRRPVSLFASEPRDDSPPTANRP